MKAIVLTKYGSPDALQLKEVAKPTLKDNEVQIKIHAATVTMGDCEIRNSSFPLYLLVLIRLYMGILKPRKQILGQELSGVIEAVGNGVTHFKIGDQVFAGAGMNFGAYAEYINLPQEGMIALKPANTTYEEAAAIFTGGMSALHFMRAAHIRSGQKVLIIGAAGSIGTFGIQLAKSYGAEVTAVDSIEKLDLLRSLGADHVIDYTREDFTKNGDTYDVIFDVIGKGGFSRNQHSLTDNGVYLLTNPASLTEIVYAMWVSRTGRHKVIFGAGSESPDDLNVLKGLIEAGTIKSVIDRCYPLERTAEAHRYVEEGHKKGHVALTVTPHT